MKLDFTALRAFDFCEDIAAGYKGEYKGQKGCFLLHGGISLFVT
jgi:hypothetical protein